ncbi:hypothetical protein KFK09_009373 [Dendrobium nobile]|uniref:DUF4283 domain-containing protein n=1 Tax=Dendrobium nobile TaxID=94219 RepID=A0A8T3BMN5_DENNO|nr:hypothetical protein KFK09_009373 [Dendrobium nobile]
MDEEWGSSSLLSHNLQIHTMREKKRSRFSTTPGVWVTHTGSLIATELRCQWTKFGKFHLMSLGSDWVICSFFSKETMENVLSGGPWFVNGHIIGLDKWSSDFNPNSLKGLSPPIWTRMTSLPLYCWDEINVLKIDSSIGEPILIDGKMF